MANLNLDILVLPTYTTLLLSVADASIYPTNPPVVQSPSIEIDVPGFGTTILPFVPNTTNTFNSFLLGITEEDCKQPLPDGIYRIRYSVVPAFSTFVERTILRVDRLQEKFDTAFLRLNMMECDNALKKQDSVTLNTINFFIQGAIASANNCSEVAAMRLYNQANSMLDFFLRSECGCSGNNYQINFY